MAEKKTFSDSLLRTVALLGLLLVLLLGAWGIILLALNLPSIAGSIGSNITSVFTGGASAPSVESITVTAPSSSPSAQPFTISWNHTNADAAHSYTVSYACQTGLTVKAPTSAGQYQTVACNTPFNYTGATSQMTLVATAKGATVPATFTVAAIKLSDTSITASNSATVSIVGAANTNTSSNYGSSASQSTYVPAATRAALYGYADLAVQILSVTPASYSGQTVVKFQISNVGTNIAKSGWTLSAQLPLNPVYTYTATAQQALYPGDKIVYTLTYTNSQYQNGYQNQYQQQTCYSYNGYQNIPVACTDSSGYPIVYNNNQNYGTNYNYPYNAYQGGLITITADPQNFIYDLNRANNTASIAATNY